MIIIIKYNCSGPRVNFNPSWLDKALGLYGRYPIRYVTIRRHLVRTGRMVDKHFNDVVIVVVKISSVFAAYIIRYYTGARGARAARCEADHTVHFDETFFPRITRYTNVKTRDRKLHFSYAATTWLFASCQCLQHILNSL